MPSSRTRRPGRALAALLALSGLLPAVAAAEQRVGGAPSSSDGYVALASAFMVKARESGDPGYYGRAQAAVARALVLDPDHYEALRVVPWVRLGLHDFRGALAAAERARVIEPDDWWNYGTLADAYAELGD